MVTTVLAPPMVRIIIITVAQIDKIMTRYVIKLE